MPPNSTVERLTLGSSVRSGVYSGSNVTSWPRATSSAASALSRRQLPQYMPPAPAVMERIFMYQLTSMDQPATFALDSSHDFSSPVYNGADWNARARNRNSTMLPSC